MAAIQLVRALEILDSRGNPTVKVVVRLNDGTESFACCPSGASVGKYEALELRDHDEKRFRGLGVLKAVDNVNKVIGPKLAGMDAQKQHEIDTFMVKLDGTDNKSVLGANATLSVSMAIAKAQAASEKISLYRYLGRYSGQATFKIPTPLFNIINGGLHAGGNVEFQEFMVVPASFHTYSQSLYMGATIYSSLRDILKKQSLSTLVGDEGGFAPNLPNNMQAFAYIKQAVDATTYKIGLDVFLGLDAAANTFFADKLYHLKDRPDRLSSDDLIAYYQNLYTQYRILYLEDPFSEDDWDSWKKLNGLMSQTTIITGDDLTATNPYRLSEALQKGAITGIIIKPNQIGTVIEALAVSAVAKSAGIKMIVSHRSGETEDSFIADFAVAAGADYVKFGAPARGERIVKYNRLLEIEQELVARQ